eukprot:scaffold18655_cov61-Phaeocystis_antarctica.AAC.2
MLKSVQYEGEAFGRCVLPQVDAASSSAGTLAGRCNVFPFEANSSSRLGRDAGSARLPGEAVLASTTGMRSSERSATWPFSDCSSVARQPEAV